MTMNQETLVVRLSPLRIAMTGIGLVLCALVFLSLAALAAMIDVSPPLLRAALLLGSLILVGLALLMLLFLTATVFRIEVAPDKVRLRLPRTRGPIPLPGVIRAELPYSAIAAVERREEIYASFGVVTVQTAFSLMTRDGVRFPLGVMAENWGLQLPCDKAADLIAARAGGAVFDHGAVRVGGIVRAVVHDVPPWTTEPISAPERARWRRRGAMTVQIIMLLFAVGAIARACSPK